MRIARRVRRGFVFLMAAGLSAGSIAFAEPMEVVPHAKPPIKESAVTADEAPAAREYMRWLQGMLDRIEADMPRITKAAELVADALIADKKLGVRGGVGLNEELGARAGGFCMYRCEAGKPGDPVVYAFGVVPTGKEAKDILAKELDDAEKLKKAGSIVIGIASYEQLKEQGVLDRARATCDELIDNHAPASDGLFKDRAGKAIIPTFTVANAAVAWTWDVEVFAACTRKGKTPAVFQSIVADPEMKRYNKYKDTRFHEDIKVEPIAAGVLGKEYLKQLGAILRDVGTAEWPHLVNASNRAANAWKDGGIAYLYAMGHYPPYHHAGQLAADPRVFTPMNPGGKMTGKPAENDFVIAIGYCKPPEAMMAPKRFWWDDPDLMRQAGRGVAWVAASFDFTPDDVKKNEIVVDQRWGPGDAIVAVKGYDVKIAPSSGVVAEAMMWMITAHAQREIEVHQAAVKKKPG